MAPFLSTITLALGLFWSASLTLGRSYGSTLRTLRVPISLPVGSPLADLSADVGAERVQLLAEGDHADYFTYDAARRRLVLAKQLDTLLESDVVLELLLSGHPDAAQSQGYVPAPHATSPAATALRRKSILYVVHVAPPTAAVQHHHHEPSPDRGGVIGCDARVGSVVPGLEGVESSRHAPPPVDCHLDVQSSKFAAVVSPDGAACSVVVARPLNGEAPGVHSFVLHIDTLDGSTVDRVPLRIEVHCGTVRYPPVFSRDRYEARVPFSQASSQDPLLRVIAHSADGSSRVFYHLVPDELPFTIDRHTGELFATGSIRHANYTFAVVATDAQLAERRAPVHIRVDAPPPRHDKLSRRRRTLRSPIETNIPEEQEIGLLDIRIPLRDGELLKNAPIVYDYITLWANGSVELTRPLNFEKDRLIRLTPIVENRHSQEDSIQSVVIHVLDLDEKPAFTNQPRPLLAVVPPKVPVGFTVFRLTAKNELGDGDTNVGYRIINTEPAGMFRLEEDGRVKTTQSSYEEGSSYRIYVQAYDLSPRDADRRDSDVAVIDVRAGKREPQFYQQKYAAVVAENTPVGASVASVQAKSFESPPGQLVYALSDESVTNGDTPKDQSALAVFEIHQFSGVINLKQALDYDSPSQPREYNVDVVAVEPGVGQSSVPLRIRVGDVNDNPPIFSQPLYTATVPEDISTSQPILKVSARDADDGANARISYSVNDTVNFRVDSTGQVFAARKLDADQEGRGYHMYELTVHAMDQAPELVNRLNASARVQIRTENVNDERPHFVPTNQYIGYVAEDAMGGTPIVTIQARDRDRDQVYYSFQICGKSERCYDSLKHGDLFEIDKDTGLIRLQSGVDAASDLREDFYNLTVIATDDGSCCRNGHENAPRHSSDAEVVISKTDVNNHKPVFEHCDQYGKMATIEEGRHFNKTAGTIIKVTATDADAHRNGEVVYELYWPKHQARKPFILDANTGELKPSPYVEFDRETRPYEDVTIKAKDKGERPLIGFCQFSVRVVDSNDNAPQFDRASYEKPIYSKAAVGRSVVTVFADDKDAPENARVTYRLESDISAPLEHAADASYFNIKSQSGEIILVSSLPADRDKFVFSVVASDGGSPPLNTSVRVVVNVMAAEQSAPEWQPDARCPTSVRMPETTAINTVFFSCFAVSRDNPGNPISYSMANGVKAGTNSDHDFRGFQERRGADDWIIVRNVRSLDFEKTSRYNLTLTATDMVSGVSTDKQVVVELTDENDEVPRFKLDKFTGQVVEEQAPRPDDKPVAVVEATDEDSPGTAASSIHYELLEGPATALFRIDASTGAIYALQSFDRERNDSFILDVQAVDGTKSAFPGAVGPNRVTTKVAIHVVDVNDNAPYFDQTLYRGQVRENAQLGQPVVTVKAHDKDRDSNLKYELLDPVDSNGHRLPFDVNAASGAVFVNAHLDYETTQNYRMKVRVTDGKYSSEIGVLIDVVDVNDNAPVFDVGPDGYAIEIDEEDENVPKTLFVVRAADADRDSTSSQIVYRLEGQGADKFFTVDENDGTLQVVRKLDRDPPKGAPTWKLVVQAIDDNGNGLTGYADVTVRLRDINDNPPLFLGGPFIGIVEENRDPGPDGAYVMQMRAIDYDDPVSDNARVSYDIRRNKYIGGKPIFRIDKDSGKIFAMRKLDREEPSERAFDIEVRAVDHGSPAQSGLGKVTVKVGDVNDNAPYFDPPAYEEKVSEAAAVGAPVLTVSASDPDDEADDNVLQYDLINKPGNLANEYFYMTTDPDSGGSNVGVLRVKQPLDFEDPLQQNGFAMQVRVTDGRHEAQAMVTVRLKDENDNVPRLVEPTEPVNIAEDADVGSHVVALRVHDPDYGGADSHTFRINRGSDPYRQFSIDTSGRLKVAKPLDRETKDSYRLFIEVCDTAENKDEVPVVVNLMDVNDNAPEFSPSTVTLYENQPPGQTKQVQVVDRDTAENGPPFQVSPVNVDSNVFDVRYDSSTQSVTVMSKQKLDREGALGKSVDLTFRLSDSGVPEQTTVRTLHVVIGDKNDHDMSDGQKTVRVYKYDKYELASETPVGRVYVQDADDWDLGDKLFEITSDPFTMFRVDQRGGMLYLNGEQAQAGNTYRVKVRVKDTTKKDDVAYGTVVVEVENLPQEAFDNSGSIRLSGITAGQFIEEDSSGASRLSRFRDKLAQLLGIPNTGNVDVFSVMQRNDTVDVRFSALNSPYRPATLLNGLVQQHRDEFETIMGADIVQVNINECFFPQCDECWTETRALRSPTLINANRTALVAVTTETRGVCGACPLPHVPLGCEPGACMNGGICHDTSPGFFCECRSAIYTGSRCEARGRSFTGDGYAWFAPPTKTCTSTNVSLEFMTTSANGMLVYFGRMRRPEPGDVYAEDFLMIRLVDGRPEVLLNVGRVGCVSTSGTTDCTGRIAIPPSLGKSLADGQWHTIDFHFKSRSYELIVDKCAGISTGSDERQCRAHDTLHADEERLNVVDPIQLGGVSPPSSDGYPREARVENTPAFTGCMRNVYWNNEMLDLSRPAVDKNTALGCEATEQFCATNTLDGPGYCVNGWCSADLDGAPGKRCTCYPGYTGERCEKRVPWVQFGTDSYIQYQLRDEPSTTLADMSLLFVTERTSGALAAAYNRDRSQFVAAKIRSGKAVAEYDHKYGLNQLSIDGVPLSSKQSYFLRLLRYPSGATLTLDGLPGLYEAELREPMRMDRDVTIRFDRDQIFLGADNNVAANDFIGCVGDFRFGGESFPLQHDDTTTSGVSIKNMVGVRPGCKLLPTCLTKPLTCAGTQVCMDFWKGSFCSCPPRMQPNIDPYGRLITCIEPSAVRRLGISNTAVLVLIMCLVALLLLVLLLVVYTRRRRPVFEELGPTNGDDMRDNIVNYGVEGGGEEDQDTYNIAPLRKPVLPIDYNGDSNGKPPPVAPRPNGHSAPNGRAPPSNGVGDVIADRLRAAEGDPHAAPYDELRVYDDEGDSHSVATLSSLGSAAAPHPQDIDAALSNWGPRFQRLADMYGAGQPPQ